VNSLAPQERILEILLQHFGSFVPVAMLTRAAHIPPAELAALIASLQQQGVSLSLSSDGGCCLQEVPDLLVPPLIRQGLRTVRAGQNIHYVMQTDSTNRVAGELAARGASEGTLVIAEEQTAGRGRMDRTWVSARGSSILCSIIFYPDLTPAALFRLTMLASVAVVRALDAVCSFQTQIKWPNDIYGGNKKLCGILTEFAADGNRVRYAVVGLGINVNDDFSAAPELADIATSLKHECGRTISRCAVLQRLLEELDRGYEALLQGGADELKAAWEHYSMILNRQVAIVSEDARVEGTARGITADGHLLLEDESGAIQEIVCGDVSLQL
jgi:BirA family transcriptional regulator, biotin operon repressor / biotin---[acetyl-CoA-carboxylase] ligase